MFGCWLLEASLLKRNEGGEDLGEGQLEGVEGGETVEQCHLDLTGLLHSHQLWLHEQDLFLFCFVACFFFFF